MRRLISTPNGACCANRRKPIFFCRIKNPQLLQNENHRNSAEIENLAKQLKFFDLEKVFHRKLSPMRQQPQNASEINPRPFSIDFWRVPGFSAMFNLPISRAVFRFYTWKWSRFLSNLKMIEISIEAPSLTSSETKRGATCPAGVF